MWLYKLNTKVERLGFFAGTERERYQHTPRWPSPPHVAVREHQGCLKNRQLHRRGRSTVRRAAGCASSGRNPLSTAGVLHVGVSISSFVVLSCSCSFFIVSYTDVLLFFFRV